MKWKVGRVWWPEHPRLRRRKADRGEKGFDAASWLPFDIADGFAVLVVAAAAIVVVVLLLTVVFPLVVLGLEILLFLLLAIAGIAGRVLLGRPWTVRARGDTGREIVWKVKGFGASGRVRDEAAQALANGDPDPRPADALPA